MSETMEPTDAMVDEAANAMSIDDYGTGLDRRIDSAQRAYLKLARITLRAALNHPDAAGLFAGEDALRAAREQGWDQATRWIDSYQGGPNGRTTSARSANPYRPVQELPTTPRTVIVPADGHEYIEAVVSGVVWRTREAVLGLDGRWHGAWRVGSGRLAVESTSSDSITPDTWKVDEKWPAR